MSRLRTWGQAPVSALPDIRGTAAGRAVRLEQATIGYNIVEGIVAVTAGLVAGSIALAGFGFDSWIEVAAAAVVLHRLRTEIRHGEVDEASQTTPGAAVHRDHLLRAGRLRDRRGHPGSRHRLPAEHLHHRDRPHRGVDRDHAVAGPRKTQSRAGPELPPRTRRRRRNQTVRLAVGIHLRRTRQLRRTRLDLDRPGGRVSSSPPSPSWKARKPGKANSSATTMTTRKSP